MLENRFCTRISRIVTDITEHAGMAPFHPCHPWNPCTGSRLDPETMAPRLTQFVLRTPNARARAIACVRLFTPSLP